MPTKHRPYLSESTIRYFYEKALAERATINEAAIAYSEIAPLAIKLDIGALKGSYTSAPRESLLDSLGGTSNELPIDPNASKLVCYNKYISNINECTEDEILTAIEYKEIVLKETLTPTEQDIINSSWDM